MMKANWQFFAVRDSSTPHGFMWHGKKHSESKCATSVSFAFYFDRVANARANGYKGQFPPGPHAPFARLPIVAGATARAARPKKHLMISVKELRMSEYADLPSPEPRAYSGRC